MQIMERELILRLEAKCRKDSISQPNLQTERSANQNIAKVTAELDKKDS